ncbi:squalene synthetase-like protein [Paraconiothyrium brasiliense]|uniref:Squalene synthetase-like protein n=1 Tax=Paraconiothyrium brasiliense TaxID=300254 RepID=A0ABR3RG71_9PLEO
MSFTDATLSATTPRLAISTSDARAHAAIHADPTTASMEVEPSITSGMVAAAKTIGLTDLSPSHGQSQSRPQSEVASDTNSVVDSHFEKRRGGRARWEGKPTEWVSRSKPGIGWLPVKDRPKMDDFVNGEIDPREAAMDDYAQNAEAFDLTSEMFGFAAGRELDLDAGSHNDWELREELEVPPDLEQDEDDGWTSDQARDLDVLSTSDDVEGIVARVTGRRTRSHGLQYQVVYEGCTRDDARWLPIAYLTTPSDKVLIEAYETKRLAREQQQHASSSSESDSEFEFNIDGDSSEEQEELDDEQLARALQRQEELGIDDNDLVLYGADEYFNGPVGTASKASRVMFDRPNKRRQQRAGGGRRADPVFPSASAMADALDMDSYSGFDIMDTDRPSLRPRKKGRRGQMPSELDHPDPDLNEQLQASWEADRRKKRLKKAEREELRKQGLLGRKDKAPNLSVKYKDGFVMEEVIEEIRDFWATDMVTLSLPVMEAHRRAVIHQFVGEFGINSKSQGDGIKRHTILSKTVRTLRFDDDLFDRTLAQKKYTRRLHAVNSYPAQKTKEKGTKNRSTVSYKDGEVVGAKAPELGVENRGRAMLEKMGWSKGMALGATDNKGILQPITHTVKITKAGLR